MTKTLKIIIGIIIAAVVMGGIWYGTSKKPAEKGTIKIGVILPLTGPYAIFGEEFKKGIDLAADEAQKNNIKFNLIYEDDQGDFGTGVVNAARKLLDVNKIDVGLTFAVEEAKPIAPLFTDKKTPLVILWDSNDFVHSAGDYIFSNGFSTEKAGEDMAEFAFKKLNLRRVALISHIDAWAEIISASFEKRFLELGGQIVFNEKLIPDTTDYRSTITKLKGINFDGIYFPLIPPYNAQFIIQARQFGISVPMMTGDAFMQDIITEVKKAAEGIYFTNALVDKNDSINAFYFAKYKNQPTGMAMALMGYNGFKKIIEAMEGTTNIQEGLLKTIGSDRVNNQEEKLYQVKNGVPVEVK